MGVGRPKEGAGPQHGRVTRSPLKRVDKLVVLGCLWETHWSWDVGVRKRSLEDTDPPPPQKKKKKAWNATIQSATFPTSHRRTPPPDPCFSPATWASGIHWRLFLTSQLQAALSAAHVELGHSSAPVSEQSPGAEACPAGWQMAALLSGSHSLSQLNPL